jgi:hypothetical protein
LLVFVGWYIYQYFISVSSKLDFSLSEIWLLIKSNWGYALGLLLLSPLNSLIEAKKWQIAIYNFLPQTSVKKSLKMVYVGAAAGLVTPSKIGEYGGRLIDIPAIHYAKALVANFYCSIAQNITNLLMGFLSILLLNQLLYHNYPFLTVSFVTLISISTLILLIVYFNLSLFIRATKKVAFLRRWITKIDIKEAVTINNDKILFWSIVRYTIYLIQYLLVVSLLDFEINILEKIGAIGIIFFLQSVVILPNILGIVARVEIAFFVWATVGIVNTEVILATLFLWLVNLAFPAIIGASWIVLERKNKI